MKHAPPKFFKRLLRWFCSIDFLEEVEGDLDEQFNERVESHGLWRARLLYAQDVMQTIRSYPVRRQGAITHTGLPLRDAFGHFLKLSFRNMARSKSTTIINTFSLAISLTSFLLISLYVIDELTYDQFHPNAGNVFRIGYSYKRYGDGVQETDARAAGLWSVAMKESMPEVKRFTRLSRFGYPGKVSYDKVPKVFVEQQFFWTDSTFTDIFRVEMISGTDAASILRDPAQVIITDQIARKYFGNDDALGQSITYHRDGVDIPLIVGGVMRAFPTNAHFHPDFIASNLALNVLWKKCNEDRINSWRDPFTYSYLEVDDDGAGKLSAGLRKVLDTHLGEDAKYVAPYVVKMTDIHFTPGKVIELEVTGDKSSIYIFGSVGVLILVIASINYMNLATARSLKRSKEVGLKKTLGATRNVLIAQFLGESILITAISLLLAIALLALLLPFFNDITSKRFVFPELFNSNMLTLLLGLLFVLGLLSGTYPAFYLSSFHPVKVLKGTVATGTKAETFRRVLVVFQFAITLFLIAGTLVIDRQLQFINKSKLSEFEEQVLTVRLTGLIDQSGTQSIVEDLRQSPLVEDVALAAHLPRQEHFTWIDARIKAPLLGETEYVWQVIDCSPDFPRLFNLEVVAGRSFSEQQAIDSTHVFINERAAKDLDLEPDRAPGVVLEDTFTKKKRTIAGVVKDFHYASVRNKILPLILSFDTKAPETMYIKLAGTNYQEAVESIAQIWKKNAPQSPYEYSFLNEQFASLYRSERQTRSIVTYFAVLAITIGCLGLFGLASFIAEQKTREIGIRKVLGASLRQILFLLTSRFIKLVAVSLIVGIPLAYFAVDQWLSHFEYRIALNAMFFIIPGILIFAVTCITVGIEAFRAALANPVESIRSE